MAAARRRRWVRRSLARAAAAACVLAAVAVTAPTASVANPVDEEFALLPPELRPWWSGLDVRNYTGPIPQQGGALIAARPLDPFLWVPGTGSAFRLFYATPDARGSMATSTAALYLPPGAPPAGGWKVIAYGHGTVGLADICAPSTRKWESNTFNYLGFWLTRGFAVVLSDYQGLGTPGVHPYLHGGVAASSIVDSVRAAHQLPLALSPRWAVLGHSQGGHAALFTSRFVDELSAGSGLDFRGTVAIAPGANVEKLIGLATPELPLALPPGLTTYALLLFAAFRDTYPELAVDEALTEQGRALVDLALVRCTRAINDAAAGVRTDEVLTRPVVEIPGVVPLATQYLQVPAQGHTRPILLVQGLADVNVPAPLTLPLAAELAANGQPVELLVRPEADHFSVLALTAEPVAQFLDRLLS